MIKKHIANYHSHTYLCGHANGSPKDYVLEAIDKNIKELGISEHAPMANLRNRNSRLKEEDYQKYHKLLNEAKTLANIHNINFYKGMEIEYFPHIKVYEDYLKEVDYLILGQHYIIKDGKYKSTYKLNSLEDIKIYKETVIKGLKTGYFNMLCHPDLCFFNIKEPTNEMYEELREVIKVANELKIPLELNANGFRRSKREDNNPNLSYDKLKYPRPKFFKMVKEENAKVIVSSDAHRIKDLNDYAILESYKFAKKYQLNLIYKLNMNYYKKP